MHVEEPHRSLVYRHLLQISMIILWHIVISYTGLKNTMARKCAVYRVYRLLSVPLFMDDNIVILSINGGLVWRLQITVQGMKVLILNHLNHTLYSH